MMDVNFMDQFYIKKKIKNIRNFERFQFNYTYIF